MLRKDAHSAQGKMVAEATAPRRENVPGHILYMTGNCESGRGGMADAPALGAGG